MKREEPILNFHTTADGSPTLSLGLTGEKMHSRHGALSETQFIYGGAIDEALMRGETLSLLSVGMGLGYVEFVTAAKMISQKIKLRSMRSFESHPLLREELLHFIEGAPPRHEGLRQAYGQALALTARKYDVGFDEVIEALKSYRARGVWKIDGALDETQWAGEDRYQVICFDAFSPKTSPELWDEVFLEKFLARFSMTQSLFATYASRVSLKRALIKAGYALIPASGFALKRESTRAYFHETKRALPD